MKHLSSRISSPGRSTSTVFLLLLGTFFCAGAFGVPDALVPSLEPDLEMDDRLGAVLGWVDNRTLLVTAQSGEQFWERKVVRVDVEKGEVRELLEAGALTCTNPTENGVGVLAGSAASLYTGAKQPRPVLKFLSWSSQDGLLDRPNPGAGWNPWICRRTKPADVDMPAIGFLQRDVRYLEAQDGYLSFPDDRVEGPVVMVKNDKPVATVGARPVEIEPVPRYLPFRGVYVLSAGKFLMQGTMARRNEARTTEYPLITMTKLGEVRREHFRPVFERNGLEVNGETFPYARGTLILAAGRPKDGGGIYLHDAGSLRRVWCTSDGNGYDRRCSTSDASLSPDGCHLAFFARDSDNVRARYRFRPSLKVLSLCK